MAYLPPASGSARREIVLRSYSSPPPRVVPGSNACKRGMHRYCLSRAIDRAERTRGEESLRPISGFGEAPGSERPSAEGRPSALEGRSFIAPWWMSHGAKRRNMPSIVRPENVRRLGESARLSECVSTRDPSGQRKGGSRPNVFRRVEPLRGVRYPPRPGGSPFEILLIRRSYVYRRGPKIG